MDADISKFDINDIALKNSDKNLEVVGDIGSRLEKKLDEAKEYVKKVKLFIKLE